MALGYSEHTALEVSVSSTIFGVRYPPPYCEIFNIIDAATQVLHYCSCWIIKVRTLREMLYKKADRKMAIPRLTNAERVECFINQIATFQTSQNQC